MSKKDGDLRRDVKTEYMRYLEKCGSDPGSLTEFHASCKPMHRIWGKAHVEELLVNMERSVWRYKARKTGPGLRKLKKAKTPFPEILTLPEDEYGEHRRVLTRFATNHHVQLNLRVKRDNRDAVIAAYEETEELAVLCDEAARGDPDCRVSTITTETKGEAPPYDPEEPEEE